MRLLTLFVFLVVSDKNSIGHVIWYYAKTKLQTLPQYYKKRRLTALTIGPDIILLGQYLANKGMSGVGHITLDIMSRRTTPASTCLTRMGSGMGSMRSPHFDQKPTDGPKNRKMYK